MRCLMMSSSEIIYIFAASDDEKIASQSLVNAASIGVIEIRVYRSTLIPTTHPTVSKDLPLNDAPVHERGKKDGVHRVL